MSAHALHHRVIGKCLGMLWSNEKEGKEREEVMIGIRQIGKEVYDQRGKDEIGGEISSSSLVLIQLSSAQQYPLMIKSFKDY